ncbi:MAG: penicillin acylase family protein [Bacteroidota bacterium]
MRSILSISAALLCTIALIVLGSWHQPFGQSIPPIGKLINPFTGFWQNAEAVDNQHTNQIVDLPALSDKVEVVFDERLVPHIFAQNLEDAYYVQGYITAKYRLWQMDISVRATAGQLAEVMGPRLLERDRLQRRKGIISAAENTLAAWKESPEEIAQIEAYSAGVNAWIDQLQEADYPLEFKLLNYQPEYWSPLKSAIFNKSMAEALCARHSDIPATNAMRIFGDSLFQFLYPERIPTQSPVIPDAVAYDFETISTEEENTSDLPADLSSVIPFRPFEMADPSTGSNNWAVDGTKTASGYPILANDPHLGLTLPAIWYEIQIQTPEVNCYGVSLPGLPAIIIGFNENISWGNTNVGQDVLDWYTIQWANEEKTTYLLDGETKEVDLIVERIKVRGQEDVLDTVRYTIWGPVVYEADGDAYKDMAMRWLAHDQPDKKPFYELAYLTRLMGGKNYEDYLTAFNGYDTPAQNFVFASKDGDIAMTIGGKFPVKENQQGRFVQDGSTKASAWNGFIPREQVPKDKNPARGFVASANQHSASKDYPYYYNGGFDEYRGRYINRRLEQMSKVTVEDMKALQLDNYSLAAEEATPILLALLDSISKSSLEQSMYDSLKTWNYQFEMDWKAPIVFRKTMQAVYKETFDEIYTLADSMEMLFPEEWRLVDLLGNYPSHAIFDIQETDAVEQAKDVVVRCFQKIASEMEEEWTDPAFDWGKYKSTRINHLGFIPAFGVYNLMVGGYKDAPNSIKGSHGPSWRMIVAFDENGSKAEGIYPGGQSGNPGSPYYDHTVQPWVKGEYYPLYLMKTPTDWINQPLLTQTYQ